MSIGEAVTGEAFKLLLAEAFSYIKSRTSQIYKFQKLNVDEVYLKARNVERVKTIWQVDKSVDLRDFYYPACISVSNKEIAVSSLSVFPSNDKAVIQGTAGQGKSILLRYLAGASLRDGEIIPIFVELRKISERKSIEDLIVTAINEMGINIGHSELDLIYSSRKFSLLLDAFDEIPEFCIIDTISYIEGVCAKHYDQQIVITSRPGAEIQKVPYFSVYHLKPLVQNDFRPMLLKLFSGDEVVVHQILKSLNSNDCEIGSLITTPLLLTLLAITYKTYNKIPSQLHEFYERIFNVLVNRHDGTKPGFKRSYKSNLNERELEELFCAFCFFCMIEDKTSLTLQEAVSISKKSKELQRVSPSSEHAFLNDCVKNTCLLLEEGFSYHFIHKSIREYHAAKFISISPPTLKSKFYDAAKKSPSKYKVELDFLKVIDEHCFNMDFLLPIYSDIISVLKLDLETPASVSMEQIFNDSFVTLGRKGIGNNEFNKFFLSRVVLGDNVIFKCASISAGGNRIIDNIFDTIFSKSIEHAFEMEDSLECHDINLIEYIKMINVEDDISNFINSFIAKIIEKYKDVKLKQEAKESKIVDILF
ncbi:NACHT domain-containing protein [Shewanella sp. JM162201]|uniref:NACHT domain-containing protein n=1 Tax=Shewanella jiangmenensis TaxID=2837387 RepID=A0ABS5V1G8_9GAMM|nr:NACHT domain-containing protein [Shewanella jiangmenensis]MBT1443768.1 NACHT domain-containing protein [Shewanella jiangmenensis]